MDANPKKADKAGSHKASEKSEASSEDSMSSSGAGHGSSHSTGHTGGISLGDTVKKLFTAGVSAAFMTEEGLRGYLAELKLPKELLNMILSSANKSKDEITQRISKEVVAMIQKVDMAKEIAKIAETHKFKVTAEIELIKKKNDPE